jgi:hypothetical protein
MSASATNIAKVSAAVVVMVGAIGYFAYQNRGEPTRVGKRQFVCVETGKFYWFSRDDAPRILPGTNPDTKKQTLMPVSVGEDGKLYVRERSASAMRRELAELNKFVDPETLLIKSSP